ncbi:MAG: response regulator [Deltaproteobacteria bacterium]|nr:response regulator [Deltaproteobacteria bacterium]
MRVEETTSSASPASASVYELLVRSARSVTRILAIIVPPLCVVPVATGIAPLEPSLLYLAILESGFVALWWLARGRTGELWPEPVMFTATLLASGGVIFSPSHLLLDYKPYALLAPMTPLAFASLAPVRPRLTYALAGATAALYALSLWLVPSDRAVDVFSFGVMCLAMAWLGATLARDQLRLLADLGDARERALESARLKSEFLTNMSHEIRTPMTAILGFAEEVELELESAYASPRIRAALSTVRRNGAHLISLINGILDLSKIEAGKLEVVRERFSPIAIVAEVASLLGVQANEKGLALEAVAVGRIPEEIESDRTRLRQILINLVGNAIKFTAQGRVRIEVGLVEDGLEFAIVDSGCGIAPDQIERVFEMFTQVHGSVTRAHQGTGLGLGLSRKLARMLGGDVDVSSELGLGSRFSLRVPCGDLASVRVLPAASVGEFAVLERAPVAPTTTRLSGRVLLVEDGPDNQRLISAILRRAGLEVELASDGAAGCELALHSLACGDSYDVILMDMQMPVLDGYAAVKRLRSAGYRGAILALTAHAMSGDRERCLAIGCDDYASKPIRREALLQQLAGFLAKPG